jgi:glucose-6-phosphate dehydrogenase assembly protein OpcA
VTTGRVLGRWSASDVDIDTAEAAIRWIRSRDSAGVLRNAVVTLVALVDDDRREAAAALRATDALGQRVPGRFIVVSTFLDRPSGTAASIKVNLVRRGEETPICVEHVRLSVGGGSLTYLDAIVEPWILPGLPVAVWLPGSLSRAGEPVVSGADCVIIDSSRLGRPLTAADLVRLDALPCTDLAWIRLRPWRRLLAEAFTGADVAPFVFAVDRLDIYGTRRWSELLAGWLISRLGLTPSSIRLVDGDVTSVHLCARQRDQRAELVVEAVDVAHVRLAVTLPGDVTRRHLVHLPEPCLVDDLEDALLSRPGPDDLWRRAAESAIGLRSSATPSS